MHSVALLSSNATVSCGRMICDDVPCAVSVEARSTGVGVGGGDRKLIVNVH